VNRVSGIRRLLSLSWALFNVAYDYWLFMRTVIVSWVKDAHLLYVLLVSLVFDSVLGTREIDEPLLIQMTP